MIKTIMALILVAMLYPAQSVTHPPPEISVGITALPRSIQMVAPITVEQGVSSWYGSAYHGRIMANGKPFNQYAMTMACNHLPLGTRVRISREERSCVVTVTDRGPFVKGRKYDVSFGVAVALDFVERGISNIRVEVLS